MRRCSRSYLRFIAPLPADRHRDRAGLCGRGVGGAVLEEAVRLARLRGAALVWCNARVSALAFYRSRGFRVRGEQWVDPHTGPHVHMERPLRHRLAPMRARGLESHRALAARKRASPSGIYGAGVRRET